MPPFTLRLVLLLALFAGSASTSMGEEATHDTPDRDAVRLAARIDALLEASWKENGLNAAEPIDDAAFLRRVSLDLAGRVPTVAEVRRFLADESPTKRAELVDRLLEGRGYVRNFTTLWSGVLLPEAETNQQAQFMKPGFDLWLYDRLDRNTPYDELVREILTAPLNNQNVYAYQQGGSLTPVAFYQAKETKPENLAAATTRAFLGLRLECAQCHDHPFDTWERKQFWQQAAFFAGIQRNQGNGLFSSIGELFTSRSLTIPDTTETVAATYLDGSVPKFESTPRATLANWITAKENPYFAKATANRMWGHFFGRGIVDPIDDFTSGNPPSHPEVLDLLARELAEHDFDLRFLIRTITATRAYGLASHAPGASPNDPALFQRMAVKGLTAEQLFDSLATSVGHHDPNEANTPFFFNDGGERAQFIQTFRDTAATPTTRQATILQALTMMNGGFVTRGTQPEGERLLTAIVDYPFGTIRDRLDTLHLAALGRPATDAEAERLETYVTTKPEKERKQAYANVFWALLNSSEFATNH